MFLHISIISDLFNIVDFEYDMIIPKNMIYACAYKSSLTSWSNCENSSVVEHHVANVRVVGSNPISRSKCKFITHILNTKVYE